MQPYAPFVGVLLLPDRAPFDTTSPVTLSDGQPVASIHWHRWTAKARFEILDAAGGAELARGARQGFFGRRFVVSDPRDQPILTLELGFWGLASRSVVTLGNGQTLSTKGNWTSRKFAVLDAAGQPVAQILNTSKAFSWRPDSLAFELVAPVLSIVQAIGLAQCLRAAVEAQRSAAAASSS